MQLGQIDYQQYRRYYQVISDWEKRPQTHLYTTIAFTFLTISLFAWYAIRPTLQTILYLRREIVDKNEINQKMEEKIAALIEAQSTMSQIEPNLSSLSQAIPQTPDVVSIMGQFHQLANLTQASISGARVSNIALTGEASPSAAQKPGTPQEVALTMTLTGDFPQLQSFLDGIMDMRRIVTVDSVNFSQNISYQSVGGGALQMVLKIRSYYMPEVNRAK